LQPRFRLSARQDFARDRNRQQIVERNAGIVQSAARIGVADDDDRVVLGEGAQPLEMFHYHPLQGPAPSMPWGSGSARNRELRHFRRRNRALRLMSPRRGIAQTKIVRFKPRET
jgi:hypothetical protein